ncbi:hypothetical protein OSB04_029371 [Centaurea solstitialis]|uniref:Uncharacterized protein n=1 Tax=Centaurea solstitialis TaxID=347529 RepID=A0AA38SHI6_9ASTR|nr:hypothetical protein OSB04_029371 [Centaurea solstitialis]
MGESVRQLLLKLCSKESHISLRVVALLKMLENIVLEKILKDTHPMSMISDLDVESNMMSTRYFNKKVLLVLDGVDNLYQLESLVVQHEWFGPGSRIIITTRDDHLLADAYFK